jgi:rfaE bifunctional protein nucleotidyltransferase chain/domain
MMTANVQKIQFGSSAEPKTTRDKIVSMDDLARMVAQSQKAGHKVVQAHGTFDLLHLGHVKHLEAARAKGDVLVVTLTADRYVNKGPNRPVFSEYLRAEMMAALETVSWVAINESPDAVPAIKKIRANFYAKGQDYINPEGDITGKIVDERNAIEEVGGEIVFTEEVTFSSTELLNRNFNLYEPHLRSHLDQLRIDGGHEALHAIVDAVKDYSVLLVGDAIIDEYHYVLPMGKSAKENMIATRYQDEECFAGGVFAAANHVASFCKQVEVVTVLGERGSYEKLIRESLKPNVKLHALMRPDAPTTRKRRYIDPSYMRKLFEVYFMNDTPLTEDIEAELNQIIGKRISDFDVVIATDFGHGLIGRSTVDLLTSKSKFLAVNTQSNSANMGYNLITKYPRADYVCIDAPEARLAVTDKVSPIEEVICDLLPSKIACEKFVITHGQHGCVTHERGGVVHTIPAVTKSVTDTVGAGDAFLSVTAPLVASGASLNQVGFIGNVVGALKVGIVGHRKSVEKVDVMKSLTALLK